MDGLQTAATSENFDFSDIIINSRLVYGLYEFKSVGTATDTPLPQDPRLDKNSTELEFQGTLILSNLTSADTFGVKAADFLQEFISENGKLDDYKEVLSFIRNNEHLIIEIKYAINQVKAELSRYDIEYQLKLAVHTDTEQSSLKTIFLLIVGDFTPKKAFALLQSLDESLSLKISDISKFNLNVEFTD